MLEKIKKIYNRNSNKQISKFSLLQLFFWSTWALYGGYSVYYLTDIGYSNMEIGTVMSIRTFTSIIGPPILGYVCDKLQTRKTIFMLSMIILAVIIVPFPLYNKIMIIIISGLIGFFWSPQQAILDSWILETPGDIGKNYGFMRAWGSLGFAFFVTIFGSVIELWGWNFHFISYGVLVFFTILVSVFIKDNSYENEEKVLDSLLAGSEIPAVDLNIEVNIDKILPGQIDLSSLSQKSKAVVEEKDAPSPLLLFKNLEYVAILIFTVLTFIPISIIFIYLAPIIRAAGGNAEVLGTTLFFNAVSEAGILFISKYILQKFKVRPLLLFAGLFYLLRIFIVSWASSPLHFIFFGILHSLSFGIFLASTRYYVNIIAPEGLKTTAQSIVMTFAFGVGGIIASLLGGYLIDNLGMGTMFNFCIIQGSIAVLFWLAFIIYERLKT